jgi:hypothetical protein
MSTLKTQTIQYVLGDTTYATSTKNSDGNLQIGVGRNPETMTVALDVDSDGKIHIRKELQCEGINGYAKYSQQSLSQRNLTIDEYFINGAEFQKMLRDLYEELVAGA